MDVLIAWVSFEDIRAAGPDSGPRNLGPIGRALAMRKFQHALLLCSKDVMKSLEQVKNFLRTTTIAETTFEFIDTDLQNPTDFRGIYGSADNASRSISADPKNNISAHLSSGTPMMAAVWVLLRPLQTQLWGLMNNL